MTFDKPVNPNYCATVVSLSKLVDLPNCDNVKAAIIFGNQVIVGKDTKVGDVGLFFPVEVQLSKEFLSNNNLYRKAEWGNVDPKKVGFFEEHGRVRAMKFRGHKSEGFFIPVTSLRYLWPTVTEYGVEVGFEFDSINGKEICRKYVPRQNPASTRTHNRTKTKRVDDLVVEGQFRFHDKVLQLRKEIRNLHPTDKITITDKWHGTSAVIGNLLVNRSLSWWEKLLLRLGVNVNTSEYGIVWSSHTVLKGANGQSKQTSRHFYGEDIWGVVAKEVGSLIPKGMTLYGEIVGFTPNGSPIQKGYDYGCEVGQHKFLVYRITLTNVDGKVVELSWEQMREFCDRVGLRTVELLQSCLARDVSDWDDPEESRVAEWQTFVLDELCGTFVCDQMCPHNNNRVPAEGIVLRIEHLDRYEAYKLKNFAFLDKETKALDKGEGDFEDVLEG